MTGERFIAKVDKNGPLPSGNPELGACWIWMACINRHGYGSLKANHRSSLAHRVSWSLANGPIPDGLCVLHRCDVRTCVNPAHLFLGTFADNMADMVAKGRARNNPACGSRCKFARLNEDRVRAIRLARRVDGLSFVELAKRFGVPRQTIGKVCNRVTWRHVP